MNITMQNLTKENFPQDATLYPVPPKKENEGGLCDMFRPLIFFQTALWIADPTQTVGYFLFGITVNDNGLKILLIPTHAATTIAENTHTRTHTYFDSTLSSPIPATQFVNIDPATQYYRLSIPNERIKLLEKSLNVCSKNCTAPTIIVASREGDKESRLVLCYVPNVERAVQIGMIVGSCVPPEWVNEMQYLVGIMTKRLKCNNIASASDFVYFAQIIHHLARKVLHRWLAVVVQNVREPYGLKKLAVLIDSLLNDTNNVGWEVFFKRMILARAFVKATNKTPEELFLPLVWELVSRIGVFDHSRANLLHMYQCALRLTPSILRSVASAIVKNGPLFDIDSLCDSEDDS
jgi:hypothetical protein